MGTEPITQQPAGPGFGGLASASCFTLAGHLLYCKKILSSQLNTSGSHLLTAFKGEYKGNITVYIQLMSEVIMVNLLKGHKVSI